MTVGLDPLSPAVIYATRNNIKYPGTQNQATADEAAASARLTDAGGLAGSNIPAGSIKVAT